MTHFVGKFVEFPRSVSGSSYDGAQSRGTQNMPTNSLVCT